MPPRRPPLLPAPVFTRYYIMSSNNNNSSQSQHNAFGFTSLLSGHSGLSYLHIELRSQSAELLTPTQRLNTLLSQKPEIDVPADQSYSMTRWLQQQPHEEPWVGGISLIQ